MNLLIPHTWLLEHLETQATPEQIQKYVSLSGPSIERIYDKEGEPVYDIEVTTNRVDSISVRGIARECAVILTRSGIPSNLKPVQLRNIDSIKKSFTRFKLPEIVNISDLNKRTVFVVLANCTQSITPDWMAKRLRQIDQNVHNSMIDITNYVTHEIGHPIHAFDYDKVMNLGGKIVVKIADKGNKFVTLDGLEYVANGYEVVFENSEGIIIDLPGIKGTLNTSIDTQTKNILLWSESINHEYIRHASMTHGIRTVAAQINEKNVDHNLMLPTLEMAVSLYNQLCNAEIASSLIDEIFVESKNGLIEVAHEKIEKYLGVKLIQDEIVKILETLEFGVKILESDGGLVYYEVEPPSFRKDVELDVDIIEEIARIYGYHNLPSVLMSGNLPVNNPDNVDFELESFVKDVLSSRGWQEVYTYSLVSESLKFNEDRYLKVTKEAVQNTYLKIANPLTDDRVFLRRSLIPSLVEVLDSNVGRKELSVFELANVYHPRDNDLPLEEFHLTMVSNLEYRTLMSEINIFLKKLFILNYDVYQDNNNHAVIKLRSDSGIVEVLGDIYVLDNNRFAVDLLFSNLIKLRKRHPRYIQISQYPPIIQDFTLELDSSVKIGDVIRQIYDMSYLVNRVVYINSYNGKHSFRVNFLDRNRNLSEEDVIDIRDKIISLPI